MMDVLDINCVWIIRRWIVVWYVIESLYNFMVCVFGFKINGNVIIRIVFFSIIFFVIVSRDCFCFREGCFYGNVNIFIVFFIIMVFCRWIFFIGCYKFIVI